MQAEKAMGLSKGSIVVRSAPAFFRSSTGKSDPPEGRNVRYLLSVSLSPLITFSARTIEAMIDVLYW